MAGMGNGWHSEQVARFLLCLASVCFGPTMHVIDTYRSGIQ